MTILVAAGTLALLAGCATPGASLTRVPIDLREIGTAAAPAAPAASTAAAPRLELRDARPAGPMERTTIGGLSLGRVELDPPEYQLTQAVLAARIAARQAAAPIGAPTPIVATMQEFAVTTPATALYWDVTTSIRVALAVEGRTRTAEARAVERTYVFPSGEIIRRVTTQALQRFGEQVDKALVELLPGR